MLSPEYAARFAETFVGMLNQSLLRLATEETGEVTKAVLGDALRAYQVVSGQPTTLFGHADGRGPFVRASFPEFEFVAARAQAYDLFVQGGNFSLLLETEMNPWREKIVEDYNKLLREEWFGEQPVRVIVVRNTRRDRAWRDNSFVRPLTDSWRTQQSFVIVEICWEAGALAQNAHARARVHASGSTIYNTEPDDWAFSISVKIEPTELTLPSGHHVTIQRTHEPSFDWRA